ncbi:TetR/AcrR family transcriptional regulator [Methylovirgula sp. 4M-Z18]|nr:TetR/AcrR family transcriptional regulator [Methylovirgula sp. 4M-Z18]
MLVVAEEIIQERGVDGFTLREAARRAGVSPGAPAHHFGHALGLLTEVALLGFRDFATALNEADARGGADPAQRLYEQCVAYVRFAIQYPARFELMFRVDKHDHSNREFVEVAEQSFQILENAIRAATRTPPRESLGPDAQGMLTAVWSMAHGFSHLALGGELGKPQRGGGSLETIMSSLLPRTLKHFLPVAQVTPDEPRKKADKARGRGRVAPEP